MDFNGASRTARNHFSNGSDLTNFLDQIRDHEKKTGGQLITDFQFIENRPGVTVNVTAFYHADPLADIDDSPFEMIDEPA
jgi:hypothetical protein